MEKVYCFGDGITLSLISNFSHSLCYYVLKQAANRSKILLFPGMWEKIEELFPLIIKIKQIGCDFSHIQVSEDLSIKINGDGKGLIEISQGIFSENCDTVILNYEQVLQLQESMIMLSSDILTD